MQNSVEQNQSGDSNRDDKVFIDLLDPEQTTSQRSGNNRELITALLGLFFLYTLFTRYRGIVAVMVSPYNREWGIDTFMFFLPIVVLPIAILLFWLRKKAGWILSTFMTAFLGVLSVEAAFVIHKYLSEAEAIGFYDQHSFTPPSRLIAQALAVACIALVLCRSRVRESYNIDRLTMVIVLIVSILLAFGVFLLT